MRKVALFFVICYLFTWAAFGSVIILSGKPVNALPGILTAIGLFGTFVPAFAALVLSYAEGGHELVGKLFAMVTRFKVPLRWYAFAIGFLAAIRIAAALLHRVLTGEWPAFGLDGGFQIAASILFSMPFQIGEELGWRGYALPRLAGHIGYAGASLVVGLFWAVWHLPLFYMPISSNFGQILWWGMVYSVGLSVVLTWLYVNTQGSLLLTMLMHASINETRGIVPTRLADAQGPLALASTPIITIFAGLVIASSAYFLWRMRGLKQPLLSTP